MNSTSKPTLLGVCLTAAASTLCQYQFCQISEISECWACAHRHTSEMHGHNDLKGLRLQGLTGIESQSCTHRQPHRAHCRASANRECCEKVVKNSLYTLILALYSCQWHAFDCNADCCFCNKTSCLTSSTSQTGVTIRQSGCLVHGRFLRLDVCHALQESHGDTLEKYSPVINLRIKDWPAQVELTVWWPCGNCSLQI